MITLKEMQYVGTWASKIPMPGEEYCYSVIKQLEECYDLFTKLYKNKEFNILFSNGEEIDFTILDINLAHMLGIDCKNIRSEFFDEARNRIFGTYSTDFNNYRLLELILENSDKIIQNDNDSRIRAKFINYYKSQIKSEIFKKLSGFNSFNYGAIWGDDEKQLFVESNEKSCPYFLTGIRKSDFNDRYIVYTLNAAMDPKESFENKEVVIPTQMIISDQDNLRRLNATPEEKIRLLSIYKNIVLTYGIPYKLNIMNDYENILSFQAQEKEKGLILTK